MVRVERRDYSGVNSKPATNHRKTQEQTMNATRKDTVLMSAVLATVLTVLTLGSATTLVEAGHPFDAVSNAVGQQAAVRPASQDMPSVVVAAPRAVRAA